LTLLVGGIPPYNNPERSANFVAFLEKGAQAFVDVWKEMAPVSAALESRLLANDLDALAAVQLYRANHSDDVLSALPALTSPWKIICGDADSLASRGRRVCQPPTGGLFDHPAGPKSSRGVSA
jgi:hypothetical protein